MIQERCPDVPRIIIQALKSVETILFMYINMLVIIIEVEKNDV